ncbi:unnamed protein product [Closterium sp. NIES-53]
MALRPSSVLQRIALPSPSTSSLPEVPDPESDLARAASPTVTRLLATVVTDPSFESTAAFSLVTELVDFAATRRLDYVASLVTESEYVCPPYVGGELALSSDVLEDRQFELECLAAALPRFASMLLCPEGDPDALDILTLCSYAEAITGEYSSQWQTTTDIEMASWKSAGTYRDYKLHSLDFSTAFLQGSLHEEIWLRCPPGFNGSFPKGTQWSLRRPVYGLRQAPREWHDTLRTKPVALGFAPSSPGPSFYAPTLLCPRSTFLCTSSGTEHGAHHPDSVTHGAWSFSALASRGPRHSPLLCLQATCSQLHLWTSPTSGMGLALGGRDSVVLTVAMLADLPGDRLGGAASFSFSSQRGHLRLAYVASWASTTNVFTKSLGFGDHQRFCTALGLHAIVLLPCHAQRATALPAKTRLPDARAARALPARCPRTARVARTLPTLTARLSHAARAARTLPARRPHCLVPPALPARCWPAVRCPAHRIARVACMRPA